MLPFIAGTVMGVAVVVAVTKRRTITETISKGASEAKEAITKGATEVKETVGKAAETVKKKVHEMTAEDEVKTETPKKVTKRATTKRTTTKVKEDEK
ncbi:MAG: hypothetical protein HF962_03570 [Sulfurovum sp.]|nr:hypothetical protein [Sulfurovum sp.]